MSTTARHKRKGGFRKLVQSLETTTPDKRGHILDVMKKEDPEFVEEVERCLFQFDEFLNLKDLVIAELAGEFLSEPKTLALALYKMEGPLAEKFYKNMNAKLTMAVKEAASMLSDVKVREQVSARFRMITKARELEAASRFILKKYSEKYGDME